MTVGRIDISYPIIKLSQYSAHPSKAHYQALKQIFVYLNATCNQGLTYWRTESNPNVPYVEPPNPISAHSTLQGFPETRDNSLHGYVDSDWGSDRQHRRSISGIVFMLAGAAIFYKTRYQPTVALSSTEAEFAAAADSGKAALYLCSILYELGVAQFVPTVIYEDNNGARLMTTIPKHNAPFTRTVSKLRSLTSLQVTFTNTLTLLLPLYFKPGTPLS
jgi:hypothetical protein